MGKPKLEAELGALALERQTAAAIAEALEAAENQDNLVVYSSSSSQEVL